MAMCPSYILKLLVSLCAVWLVIGAAPLSAAEFMSITAVYSLKRDGQPIGHVTETYRRSGKRYRINSEAKAEGVAALFVKGPLRMSSEGEIERNGLKPLKFERTRNDKTVTVTFDWPAAKLAISDNGSSSTEALVPGTQDRLSAMYQFMFAQPKAKRIEMPMTGGKKPAAYIFRNTGRERIDSGAGTFDTVRMTRERSGEAANDDDRVEVWLASKRKFLPVRLKIREDGALYEQDLIKLETH